MKYRFKKIISFAITTAVLFCGRADAASIITTIAGGGGDGKQATSIACAPTGGITIDNTGRLVYSMGNAIWRVDDAGVARRIAGNEGLGYSGDDGPAFLAQLHSPLDLVSDGAGPLFFADSANNAIRKIQSDNTITTVIGSGVDSPYAFTRDAAGNFYVVKQSNVSQVIKYPTSGFPTVVVGTGVAGFSGDGGDAELAQLKGIRGLAFDAAGNLYLADTFNNCIRKVAVDGNIATVADRNVNQFGIGEVLLSLPRSIVAAADGTLYIADTGNHRILKMATDGMSVVFAGSPVGDSGFSGDNGPASAALINAPDKLAIDSIGNIYFADTGNNRIRKIATDATITTVAGNGLTYSAEGELGASCQFGELTDATVMPDGGIIIADRLNNVLRRLFNGRVTLFAGGGGSFGENVPATATTMKSPDAVVADGDGNVYVSLYEENRVRKISSSGMITTIAGTDAFGFSGDGGDAKLAQLRAPAGLALGPDNSIFITDSDNSRIRKITSDGKIFTVAGTSLVGFYGDNGQATNAALFQPTSIDVDTAGNLWIADYFNDRIRRVSSDGVITTAAGGGVDVSDGILATAARLNHPYGVRVDASGNIYISESVGDRVRVVRKSDGKIFTVVGTGQFGFSGDGGSPTTALLHYLGNITLSGADLLIDDAGNHRLRRATDIVPVARPNITNVTPNSGPMFGGQFIKIFGAAFQAGATVTIGDTVATSVSFINSNELDARTPAGTAGAKDVIVTNPDAQSFTLPNGFTYVPPPFLTSVTPNSGPTAGGTNITIGGTGFQPDDTVSIDGVAVTNLMFVNSTQLTATTPAGSAGFKNVHVMNSGIEGSTLLGSFEYIAPPVITSVTPNQGFTIGGTGIVIRGSGFQIGATVLIDGNPATNLVRVSPTEINAAVPPGTPGPKDVVVQNPDGQTFTLPNGFTYIQPPHIVSVTPSVGPVAGGTNITIVGLGFTLGATVNIQGVPATNVVFVNSTQLTATTPVESAGVKFVSVDDGNGLRDLFQNGFTYVASNVPPTVELLSPAPEAEFVAPATISINASAADADGTVVKVDFFNGGEKIGDATNAPYQFSWTNIPVGAYEIHARATDDQGATTASSNITVIVSAPVAIPPPAPAPALTTSITIGRPDEGKPIVVRTPLDHAAHVEATAYNRRGVKVKKVIDDDMAAGMASITWDGRDDDGSIVEPGVYMVLVQVDGSVQQKEKVVIIRE